MIIRNSGENGVEMSPLLLIPKVIIFLRAVRVAYCQPTVDERSRENDNQNDILLELKRSIGRYGIELQRQQCAESADEAVVTRNRQLLPEQEIRQLPGHNPGRFQDRA